MTKEQAVELGITFDTDNPTPEEIDAKVSARVAELAGENGKLKNSISKVNSENAEYKRKAQEKLTEDEKVQLHQKELEEKIAGYERQFAKSNKVSDYLSIGYSKELAEKIADAELEGKSTAEYHKQHILAREEALKKELMVNNPNKVKQSDPNGAKITKEEFAKMTYSQKIALKESDPTLYEQLSQK